MHGAWLTFPLVAPCPPLQMQHFDAGVRHWLVQLTTAFGESETLAGLRSIAAAQNLPGVRWESQQVPLLRLQMPPDLLLAASIATSRVLPPDPSSPLHRNMKAFITTRLIDHYEMLIWAQGKRGSNPVCTSGWEGN